MLVVVQEWRQLYTSHHAQLHSVLGSALETEAEVLDRIKIQEGGEAVQVQLDEVAQEGLRFLAALAGTGPAGEHGWQPVFTRFEYDTHILILHICTGIIAWCTSCKHSARASHVAMCCMRYTCQGVSHVSSHCLENALCTHKSWITDLHMPCCGQCSCCEACCDALEQRRASLHLA